MKQSNGYREIAWMLLPSMLLLGIGLYFQLARPGQLHQGDKPVISEIRLFPATPRDAAQGYDTIVEIPARSYTPPEGNTTYPTLSFSSTGNLYLGNKRFEHPTTGIFQQQIITRPGSPQATNIARFAMKLADLPPSAEPISVRGAIEYKSVTKKNGPGYVSRLVHRLPFSVIVRLPSQKIARPVVSHTCPVRVSKVSFSPVTIIDANGVSTKQTELQVTLQALLPDTKSLRFDGQDERLVAEHNGRFTKVPWSRKLKTNYIQAGRMFGPNERPDLCYFVYTYQEARLPTELGTLWIEGSISLNDSWPMRMRVLIRRSKPSDPKVGTVRTEVWPPGGFKKD